MGDIIEHLSKVLEELEQVEVMMYKFPKAYTYERFKRIQEQKARVEYLLLENNVHLNGVS